jgi:dihydroflavonol-4-reductase
MELGSKISGTAPLLSTKDIAMFSGLKQDFDLTKSKRGVGL